MNVHFLFTCVKCANMVAKVFLQIKSESLPSEYVPQIAGNLPMACKNRLQIHSTFKLFILIHLKL